MYIEYYIRIYVSAYTVKDFKAQCEKLFSTFTHIYICMNIHNYIHICYTYIPLALRHNG